MVVFLFRCQQWHLVQDQVQALYQQPHFLLWTSGDWRLTVSLESTILISADHHCLSVLCGVPGGVSVYRGPFDRSIARFYDVFFVQGPSDFSLADLLRIQDSTASYCDNRLLAAQRFTVASLKRDADFAAAVLGKKTLRGIPLLFGNALSPDSYLMGPPSFHCVIHIAQDVLRVMLDRVFPALHPALQKINAHLQSQATLIADGRINAAGANFRRMVAEYVQMFRCAPCSLLTCS